MPSQDFGKYISKIGGELEVAGFVELFGSESRPLSVDFAAFDRSAGNEEAACMAMIGTAGAVLTNGAAELRHRENDDVAHAIAEIVIEGSETIAEIFEAVRELAACGTLIGMGIPPADIREGHFETDIGFDQLGDLQQRLAER